jgi:lipid-A-disaccharide synthase
MTPLIWISAGEASGDLDGALLAAELKRRVPDARIEAVGGPRLAHAADTLLYDSSRWGAIGIVRSLPKVPRLFAAYRRLQRRARSHPPDLLIPIDFGAFNIPLARKLRAMGTKVLYYMPPGSWRKDRQGRDLPAVSDAIATPFEWSARLLTDAGANAEWVGHPLLDAVPVGKTGPREALIVVLPGSRDHEVRANLPAIAKACALLGPDWSFAAALTPHVPAQWVRALWSSHCRAPLETRVGENAELLGRARAAIICSGTATLEAVVARCPLVVVYGGDLLMRVEYGIRRPQFDFIALPSILVGRKVCEELLQDARSPERIASELQALLEEGPPRQAQLAAFEEVAARLGSPGATARTADLAMRVLERIA